MAYQYPPSSDQQPTDSQSSVNLLDGRVLLPPVLPPDGDRSMLAGVKNTEEPSNEGSSRPGALKRSSSTPNIRGQAAADEALAASAEKRRNKLGYHRTSVACKHCRRRKIRCIAEPGDLAGRCKSCIRLKKECIYQAVEPTNPLDTRNHRGSLGSSIHDELRRKSSSTSPSNRKGPFMEGRNGLPYPQQRMSTFLEPRRSEYRQINDDFSSSKAPMYGLASAGFPSTTSSWIPSDPTTTMKPPETSNYWGRMEPTGSSTNSSISSFSPSINIPHQPSWQPASAVTQPSRADLSWSLPQRSMSVGNFDSLLSQAPFPQYQPLGSTQREGMDSRLPQQNEGILQGTQGMNSLPTLANSHIPALGNGSEMPPPLALPPFQPQPSWRPPSAGQYTYKQEGVPASAETYSPYYTAAPSMVPNLPLSSEQLQQPQYNNQDQYNPIYYPGDNR